MVTLVALQQQLQLQNSTLQTSQDTIQQNLASSVKLEVKDDDFVVLADMMVNSPELKNIPQEMKTLQDEKAVLAQHVQERNQVLKELGVELKKPPAEKAILDRIKNELNTLLTPQGSKAPESTLDELLGLSVKKLNHVEFKKNFDLMLKKKIHINGKTVLIGNYIVLQKLEQGKKYFGLVDAASVYLPVFSSKGKALADHVVREQRFEKQLGDLQQSITDDEVKAQQLNERVTQFQTRCVADIKRHVDQAKVAAEQVVEKIQKAKEFLDEIEALKTQAEKKLVAYLALDEKANLVDFAGEMAQIIQEIESKKSNGNTLKAEQARRLLTEATAECVNNQRQFGQAAIWKRLPKKNLKQQNRLDNLPEKLETTLENLRKQKALLDARIEEKKRKVENAVRVKPLPANNNIAEAARYKTATDEYLERLAESIHKHLILFKESAEAMSEDQYLLVTRWLKLGNKTEVSDVLPALKKAYLYDGDKTLQQEIDKALMPNKKDEQQESLRDTLHKYRLMTELSAAADESSKKFLGILAKDENKTLLAKRRDNSFMLWAKSCGKAVAAVLGLLDATYGLLFSSHGKNFAKEFGRVPEPVMHNEKVRRSPSRSAGG